ncbi:hypothetical protein M3T53_09850, partial [Actinomyces sp. B33]|nr:hypothetical protein [Actinomyces sp. B33]
MVGVLRGVVGFVGLVVGVVWGLGACSPGSGVVVGQSVGQSGEVMSGGYRVGPDGGLVKPDVVVSVPRLNGAALQYNDIG